VTSCIFLDLHGCITLEENNNATCLEILVQIRNLNTVDLFDYILHRPLFKCCKMSILTLFVTLIVMQT